MKRFFRAVGKIILGLISLIILFIPVYVYMNRGVITGYAAKKMCTCVFMGERSPETVYDEDFNIFPNSLTIKNADTEIDTEAKAVVASFWGMEQEAQYREGLGCALTKEEAPRPMAALVSPTPHKNPDTLVWPWGEVLPDTTFLEVEWDSLEQAVEAGFDAEGEEEELMTRAVLVVYKGHIIAEKYADGFEKDMPQHGWSMGKSITNALVGIRVRMGAIDIHKPVGLSEWQGDDRQDITLDHLMRMSSGLAWNEGYFGSSDVTHMLYQAADMGGYAASQELGAPVDTEWNYSSGTTNIISLILRQGFESDEAYWQFPFDSLFHKIGMYSSFLEADASGTYVCSSFAWGTPRDWARFGLLYLQDGVWQGERILPEGWVDYSTTPTPTTSGFYGAQFWLNAGKKLAPDLPEDAYCARGHDGQRVYIIPSYDMVVVRLGLKNMDDNAFVTGILRAIER